MLSRGPAPNAVGGDAPEQSNFKTYYALPAAKPSVAQLALEAVKAKRAGAPDVGIAVSRFFSELEEVTGGVSFEVLFMLRREGILP